jgi:aspartyl-tRNA(Asn)/glutamyl-tRNA(Gln) amidotransferase subunit C
MSHITENTIKKIAQLAKIRLNESQLPHYQQSLENILTLVEKINGIAVDTLSPLASPLEATLETRDDKVVPVNNRDALLALAPASEAGLYLVPKVIESE